jgi:hypothetical protein
VSEALNQEVDNLRITYNEIIAGFSYFREKNCYFKHLNEIDFGRLSENRRDGFLKFKKEGLPTEAERLKYLIGCEAWSKEKEEEIVECRYAISDNEKHVNLQSNLIPQQREMILKIVNDYRIRLKKLLDEKSSLIGATAESYADVENTQYLIYLGFYKDEQLKTRSFAHQSELEDFEDEELGPYFQFVSGIRERINEDSIQSISVLPFFLNNFSYSKENIQTFLGKPVIDLSSYQLSLFSFGVRNLSVLSNTEGEPPEMLGDVTVRDVRVWFDTQYSVLLGKRKSSK